jgi:gamma-glutamyl:cysteine ligase YbdK (ATP-grasp superfamily)
MSIDITLNINLVGPDGTPTGLAVLIANAVKPLLDSTESKIMSKLDDDIKALSDSFDAATGRIQAEQAALQAKIDELQATVDSGGATPEQLKTIEDLKAKFDQIDAAVAPTPEPSPTPPPGS